MHGLRDPRRHGRQARRARPRGVRAGRRRLLPDAARRARDRGRRSGSRSSSCSWTTTATRRSARSRARSARDGFGTHYRCAATRRCRSTARPPAATAAGRPRRQRRSLGAAVIRARDDRRAARGAGEARGADGPRVVTSRPTATSACPSYESWWDVPVAEVSDAASVRGPARRYERGRAAARATWSRAMLAARRPARRRTAAISRHPGARGLDATSGSRRSRLAEGAPARATPASASCACVVAGSDVRPSSASGRRSAVARRRSRARPTRPTCRPGRSRDRARRATARRSRCAGHRRRRRGRRARAARQREIERRDPRARRQDAGSTHPDGRPRGRVAAGRRGAHAGRPLVELPAAQARPRRAAAGDAARGDLLPPRRAGARLRRCSACTPTTARSTKRSRSATANGARAPRLSPRLRAAGLRGLLPQRDGRAAPLWPSPTTPITSGR